MPIYNFECTKCNNVYEDQQMIKDMDKPLKKPCPSCGEKGFMIRIVGSPNLGEAMKLETTKGLLKPSNDFNDRLREIKKNYAHNKIEVRE